MSRFYRQRSLVGYSSVVPGPGGNSRAGFFWILQPVMRWWTFAYLFFTFPVCISSLGAAGWKLLYMTLFILALIQAAAALRKGGGRD